NGNSIFGANALLASTTRGITVSGTVNTSSGGITLRGNQQAAPTSGNFFGILVSGTVSSATGAVQLTGRGGNTGNLNIGVAVAFGGLVRTTGTGSVTVTGVGGPSTGNANYGVDIQDEGSQITSGGGLVQVTGTGGGTGTASDGNGVFVVNGAQI